MKKSRQADPVELNAPHPFSVEVSGTTGAEITASRRPRKLDILKFTLEGTDLDIFDNISIYSICYVIICFYINVFSIFFIYLLKIEYYYI
jgi:hypothetical protein